MTVEADSQSVLLSADGTHSAESQRTDAQMETFSLFTLTHQTHFNQAAGLKVEKSSIVLLQHATFYERRPTHFKLLLKL